MDFLVSSKAAPMPHLWVLSFMDESAPCMVPMCRGEPKDPTLTALQLCEEVKCEKAEELEEEDLSSGETVKSHVVLKQLAPNRVRLSPSSTQSPLVLLPLHRRFPFPAAAARLRHRLSAAFVVAAAAKMVKAYLRYEPALAFGVITSGDANICYDPSGRHLLAPALDKFALWDLKKGLPTTTFSPSASPPPPPTPSLSPPSRPPPPPPRGHADGSIRLWDCEKGTCEATLNGHKSAATVLRYNHAGSLLASGSKDCDVILWDVVGEAGIFRLRGHRDQVTDLSFIDSGKKLVTCSKDKFMRVWDLETQHCIQIVGGHHTEIWSLDVDPKERFLVSGSADPELRFYQIRHNAEATDKVQDKWEILKQFGEIQRKSKYRVASVRFDKSGSLLACQVAGKAVEIYRVLDDSEAMRKSKRRLHRKKEKVLAKSVVEGNENGSVIDPLSSQEVQHPTIVVSDVFKFLRNLPASNKICSIAFCPNSPPKGALAVLTLSLNNNMLETHLVDSSDSSKSSKMNSVELQGHRSYIRSVALNSESNLLMSTSHNAVKIWNPSTGACLRTIDSEYGLSSCFVPGNRYALVGTKNGKLEIIDIGSGSLTEVVEAHAGPIRSIVPIPDENGSISGRGFVTGSADKDVKFWEYQILQTPDSGSKKLSVANVRTLKMNDDVLVVSISPNGKYIAVALLDCTVKVFFVDTLKYFQHLYGHKLPVFCMDFSSDGDLLVTGSADKNLRIWGLDFGDIRRSIFAHADSVMDVKFVKNTHYMFSVGKDRLVKYWDADKFELLLTLEGHHDEVSCLAVSNRGDFIVTGSHDRSIRRWDRTEEPLFIEEERGKRLEEMFDSDLDNSADNRYAPKEVVPEEGSVGVPGKKTQESLTAADVIIDALDTAEEEIKRINQYKEDQSHGQETEFQPNVLMRGHPPSDFVLHALSNVPANDVEQMLLSLPFSDALKLMSYLREWALIPDKVELVCRVCTVLLQTHHNQLTTTVAARPMLTSLKDILHERVKECKDTVGFNLAAMDHLKELMSMKSDALFRDAKATLMEIRMQQSKRTDRREINEKRKKKKHKVSAVAQAAA
uniref:Small-subunit processome Utp12 domain-containing protein n=1 Tax=Ananas comosus var. bracteatus TaxID=296719 RepID=A0A6V7PYG4_ANACO|nr:unnamed protein product [Ananas comosus var. bracteatus]